MNQGTETDLIAKIACLAARVTVLNQRIQKIIKENIINDNVVEEVSENNGNIVENLLKPTKKQKTKNVEKVLF